MTLDAPRPTSNGSQRLFGAAAACLLAAVLVAGIMAGNPLAGVAVVFPITYWAMCWYRPHWALFLIFAACPIQTDLTQGHGPARFSLSEVLLLLTVPALAARVHFKNQRVTFGPLAFPLFLYLVACLVSSIVQWRGNDAIVSIVQVVQNLVFGVLIFAFLPDNRRHLRIAAYGLVFSGVCIIPILADPVYNPLGMNKNGIGTGIAFAMMAGTELWLSEEHRLRRWILTVALLLLSGGLILSLSRGAWLSAAAGFAVILLLRRRAVLLLKLAIILVPVAYICWHFVPAEQQEYATSFDSGRINIQMRYLSIDYALAQFRSQPIFGVGIGLRKQYDATNVVLLTMAETGLIGLSALVLLHLALLSMCWSTYRRLPAGDGLATPVILGAAFIVARFAHGLVDHYWGRGSNTLAWAAAGMALGVWSTVRAARFGLPTREWPLEPRTAVDEQSIVDEQSTGLYTESLAIGELE